MLDAAIIAALRAPFPASAIELKPGATTRDKTRALALAYADPRVYQERLDAVLGPSSWCVEYRPLGAGSVICRLTLNGVVREDVGEATDSDPNRATVAVAQAFKRACAAFGLGRYLYGLEQVWAEYDADNKAFKFPERIVSRLYKTAGIPENPPPPAPQARTARRDPVTEEVFG